MCRAMRVLCAAPDHERLAEMKRAAVSASWELVGGASSIHELVAQVEEWMPDVVVVDVSFGSEAVEGIREGTRRVRIVSVGSLPGVDATAESPEDLRNVILGLPGPGGPVRT